jgi:GTP-binding protein Era
VTETVHRAGVVALLGRPNAGKSTLLNRLLGQKLAIVTDRPQTTRSRILGILTRPGAQLLLLDTPGFHEAARPLNRALNAAVEEAAGDCDVALLLVDPAAGWDAGHAALLARLAGRGVPVLVVATRCDLAEAAAAPWPPAGAAAAAACLRISARTGEGVEGLLEAVEVRLPEGPAFYGEDELTDRPLRFLAAELVREAAFEALSQELPYALAVEVESFDESRADLVRIRAHLLVERPSQKPIVVGRGGSMIRSIGIEARLRIEALLGTRVHLDLWVKVEPRWSRKPRRLQALGYGPA